MRTVLAGQQVLTWFDYRVEIVCIKINPSVDGHYCDQYHSALKMNQEELTYYPPFSFLSPSVQAEQQMRKHCRKTGELGTIHNQSTSTAWLK
jgi:hypothetical protein